MNSNNMSCHHRCPYAAAEFDGAIRLLLDLDHKLQLRRNVKTTYSFCDDEFYQTPARAIRRLGGGNLPGG
jgi:hypothetical protein